MMDPTAGALFSSHALPTILKTASGAKNRKQNFVQLSTTILKKQHQEEKNGALFISDFSILPQTPWHIKFHRIKDCVVCSLTIVWYARGALFPLPFVSLVFILVVNFLPLFISFKYHTFHVHSFDIAHMYFCIFLLSHTCIRVRLVFVCASLFILRSFTSFIVA